MSARWLATSLAVGLIVGGLEGAGGKGQTSASRGARPGFHHLHMNSMNASAAIGELLAVYPASTEVTEAGSPGIRSANGVTILFTTVRRPPAAPGPDKVGDGAPQTAFWHHVWAVTDGRRTLAELRSRIPDFDKTRFISQYTGFDGGSVDFSSDTFAGFLTTSQVVDARRHGVVPPHKGGYFNWYGPDGVIMETADGGPEAYRIVGMFQEQPFCAVLWYRRHLNAGDLPATAERRGQTMERSPLSDATCQVSRGQEVSWPSTYKRGHYRVPPAQSVFFDDVQLRWYMNQEERPLAPTHGQLMDHIALSVTGLDNWVARLKADGVRFLEPEYRFGDSRAVMIEGPSREAIELVEIR